jgi:hypothetical protein
MAKRGAESDLNKDNASDEENVEDVSPGSDFIEVESGKGSD